MCRVDLVYGLDLASPALHTPQEVGLGHVLHAGPAPSAGSWAGLSQAPSIHVYWSCMQQGLVPFRGLFCMWYRVWDWHRLCAPPHQPCMLALLYGPDPACRLAKQPSSSSRDQMSWHPWYTRNQKKGPVPYDLSGKQSEVQGDGEMVTLRSWQHSCCLGTVQHHGRETGERKCPLSSLHSVHPVSIHTPCNNASPKDQSQTAPAVL